jgi:hypothetical protein
MTIPVAWWTVKVGRLCFRTFSSAPENGFLRGHPDDESLRGNSVPFTQRCPFPPKMPVKIHGHLRSPWASSAGSRPIRLQILTSPV